MGVWIETNHHARHQNQSGVTPFVGVWIETFYYSCRDTKVVVTPFVGVWIETFVSKTILASFTGHTLRGCVD